MRVLTVTYRMFGESGFSRDKGRGLSKRAAGAYFSPKLFENPALKRLVRFVQRWVP